MAEIIVKSARGGRGRRDTTVDLTPMVDLGFLLISFFMFTTTLANHKALPVTMPSKEPTNEPTAFASEATITLMPAANHAVVYYSGFLNQATNVQIATMQKLRQVLIAKKKEVAALPGSYSADAHRLHVLIKPTANCTYGDVVNILDEMNIVDIPVYALVDLTEEDRKAMLPIAGK